MPASAGISDVHVYPKTEPELVSCEGGPPLRSGDCVLAISPKRYLPMFRIHKKQMEFFGKAARADFDGRMVRYLAEHWAEVVGEWPQWKLEAWVESAVNKALYYHVDTEPEAAQLVLLFLRLGVNADESMPWVRAVLDERALAPIGKVRRLIEEALALSDEGLEPYLVFEDFRPPLRLAELDSVPEPLTDHEEN